MSDVRRLSCPACLLASFRIRFSRNFEITMDVEKIRLWISLGLLLQSF
jgi:hypothetical protein